MVYPPVNRTELVLKGIDTFLLFGGSPLLANAAVALKKPGVRVLAVTSPRHAREPADPAGKPLDRRLKEEGIELLVCERLEDSGVLEKITPTTLGLSMGAAWIFSKEWIARFDGRLLNLHGARLPQDRGGGGFSWYILRGNRVGCCLIHQVDEGIDTGPIVKFREFLFPASCRIPRDYMEVYVRQNLEFLSGFFSEMRGGGSFPLTPQLPYLSTYWPRLSTDHHGVIDWSWTGRQIEQFICAFDEPYRGASTWIGDRRLFLKGCDLCLTEGTFHPFQTGLIYRKSGGALFVASGEGALVIRSVTDDPGRDALEELKVGDRFHTPREILEAARKFRAVYSGAGLTERK